MPLVVDASQGFDRLGVRYTERGDLRGLPPRTTKVYYVRRSFRVVDEVGAEQSHWAVLAIPGRLYRGITNETANPQMRIAAVLQAKFATNSGVLTPLDKICEEDGWWRIPARANREVWEVDGDPYVALGNFARPSHYEVTVRRVDG